MLSKIICTVGISGSGKTTWGRGLLRNTNFVYVDKDSIRNLLTNSLKWDNDIEALVVEIERHAVESAIKRGFSVVVCNTHLGYNNKHLSYYRQLAEKLQCDFQIKTFDVPLKTCLERNNLRNGWEKVPEKVIMDQYKQLQSSKAIEKKEVNIEEIPSEDIYIVADLHQNHIKLTPKFWNDRPYDFTEIQLKNLYHITGESLINLGDLCFGQEEEKLKAVEQYNRVITQLKNHYYIYGNHDLKGVNQDQQITEENMLMRTPAYFMEGLKSKKYYKVAMAFNGKKILFSHIPLDMSLYPDYDYNIHGHIHRFKFDGSKRATEDKDKFTLKHLLISMEYQNMKPVKLSYVLNNLEKFQTLKLYQEKLKCQTKK